mgnify:FL=1
MGGLFWFLPTIVEHLHGMLGLRPGPLAKNLFDNHLFIILGCFIGAWVALEGQAKALAQQKAHPSNRPNFQARIRHLARKAGLSRTPDIIIIDAPVPGMIGLNAAAAGSIFHGNQILAIGGVIELLEDREEEVVFAHEIAHLIHLDVPARAIIMAGQMAIRWQKWLVLMMTCFAGVAGPELWGDFRVLVITWLCISLVQLCYSLLAAAHSRCREYLADAGGLAIAGWDYRDELVAGLIKVGHVMSGKSPFKLLQKTGMEIFASHPDAGNRAAVIGVKYRADRHGNVRLTEE